MVLREAGDDVLCIGQAAHAWISGQLARRWGNAGFERPDPFEDVCLGVAQHDVGMAEWDLHPELNPDSGRPRSFMEMPLATHLRLWRAAPHKVLTQSPYAALIVSMHGAALYARRASLEPGSEDARAVREFLTEQEHLQQRLLDATGADTARARLNQRLVWALDFLSLALLLDWAPDTTTAPTRLGEPDAELELRDGTLSPWPFDGDEVTVRAPGRRLAGRYDSQEALDEALARAPWEVVSFTLRRAG